MPQETLPTLAEAEAALNALLRRLAEAEKTRVVSEERRAQHAFAAASGDLAAIDVLAKIETEDAAAAVTARTIRLGVAEARARVEAARARDAEAAAAVAAAKRERMIDALLDADDAIEAALADLRDKLEARAAIVTEIAPMISNHLHLQATVANGQHVAEKLLVALQTFLHDAIGVRHVTRTSFSLADVDARRCGRKEGNRDAA
jgi:hypothetical protein